MENAAFNLLIPSISSGLLLAGLILFIISSLKTKAVVYISMTFMVALAFLYCSLNVIQVIAGDFYKSREVTPQIYRLMAIVVTFFFGAIPHFTSALHHLGRFRHHLNQGVMYFGFFLSFAFTITAVAFPDSFLSVTRLISDRKPDTPKFGLGEAGPLLHLRDGLFGLYMVYFLAITLWEFLVKGRKKSLLLSLFGVLCAIYLSADELLVTQFHHGVLTPLPMDFPRFLVGITIFIFLSMASAMYAFLVKSQKTEAAEHEVQKNRTQMIYLAFHDQFTGLPNRTSFFTKLEESMVQSIRNHQNRALFYMDLDNLKEINDSLGHHVGDLVILEVSRRIKALIRSTDSLFRLGGDEFALILNELHQATDGAIVAQKIIRDFDRPLTIAGQEVYTGISIGIAIFPKDSTEINDLVKKTNEALSAAKVSRNDFQFFTDAMNKEALTKLQIINGLKESISKNSFDLHYQPLVSPHGQVEGVEALIRWSTEGLGPIPPDVFIPLAEATGLIQAIGAWVLKRAFSDLQKLMEAGFEVFFSINLSTKQLNDSGLFDLIDQALKTSDIPVERVHLEITESALIEGSQSRSLLDRLAGRGLTLVIDDFGMGYSSLSYLKNLPVKSLKIDRSFISPLPGVQKDEAIVKSIIDLANGLELEIVAEGVETKAQSDFLWSQKCHLIQGYFYAKPMPFHELVIFLHRTN